jgi:hypothetical protein
MNVAKQLSLDPERVALATDVYEGFARANSEGNGLEAMVLSGSCFTIAASYAAAFDAPRSKQLFHRAAEVYYKQAHVQELAVHEHRERSAERIHEGKLSFARVLAVCGTQLNQISHFMRASMQDARAFHSPETTASLLLAETMIEMHSDNSEYRPHRHRLIEDASRMRSYEVGRVRLPMVHFLRLAELPEDLERRHSEKIQELCSSVLSQIEYPMEGAVKSRHWKELQCSMLPIEPEVLGMCLVLDGACRKVSNKNSNLHDMVGNRVRGMSSAYVSVAVEFGKQDEEEPYGQSW